MTTPHDAEWMEYDDDTRPMPSPPRSRLEALAEKLPEIRVRAEDCKRDRVDRREWGYDPADSVMDDFYDRQTEDLIWVSNHAADLIAAGRALHEVHEYHCGCNRPGNPAACVMEPVEEYVVLNALLAPPDASPPGGESNG